MKFTLLLFILSSLCSCDNSINQLNDIKKPAVVFALHKPESWYENPSLIIQDADGNLINLRTDIELQSFVDKYTVGDTIK